MTMNIGGFIPKSGCSKYTERKRLCSYYASIHVVLVTQLNSRTGYGSEHTVDQSWPGRWRYTQNSLDEPDALRKSPSDLRFGNLSVLVVSRAEIAVLIT